MCGIIGAITCNSVKTVINGLIKLQNRGYDSAGICSVVNSSNFLIRKYISTQKKSAIEKLNKDKFAPESNISIGHTRWATHGARTLANAHPHHDELMNFVIVHNGIIENYLELKEELVNLDYQFYGQTDTEVIAKYISHLSDSFLNLNSKMRGSWAILILDKRNLDRIFFMKNGAPLILGYNESKSKIMLVSELSGFDSDIEYYYSLLDGEQGYVSSQTISTVYEYTPQKIQMSIEQTMPDPYPYWTIKEINDQKHIIKELIKTRIVNNEICLPELESIDLSSIEHFIFLACGTSYHAAQIGLKYFRELRINATTEVIDGADFEECDLPANRKTLLILLSQSGETKDLYRALIIGKEYHKKSIGIINVENSLIAREVDACLYLKAGREHAVASTKAFTSQCVMLLLLSLWMSPELLSIKQEYINALAVLDEDISNIIDQTELEIPLILPFFTDKENCFILGKQQCEWTAKEGSLKIKEITYIHSEGYSAAALKHGPFSLLNPGMPVILIANNDRFCCKVENIAAEIKSRNALVIYITNKKTNTENIDYLFYFNNKTPLFPILSVIPLQILAYHLALARGNNPDYPRNLAKVVTVE